MTEVVRLSWKDVRDRVHGRVLDGTYAPGDRLPRDEDLAEEFGCARSTVQRAMQDLSLSGIVERRRKGGTRVRRDPVTRATLDIPITRNEVENRGAVYGYRLIGLTTEAVPPPVTAKFEMAGSEEMLRVRALHLADGHPFVFEDRWVSLRTVPEILEIDLAAQSANEWLVRNKPYTRCDLRFYAMNADAETAAILETGEGAALMVIERTTWIGLDPITSVKAVTAPGYEILTRS
ncbi:GntR family transcriptional regulator [Salinihabitans flavidus]|uniref:GntR family transcriptional regulator n=1 Tax=Salinihabitans flavidus TaxID=569882 RepID=UPI000B8651AD|nr:GntR family transcriptional regulator [Salinihabitans flavidus]